MKGLRSYLDLGLALGMLVMLFWQTGTIIYFYANQDYIADTYFINKENPKKPDCKVQCHLKTQLEKSTSSQGDDTGVVPKVEASLLILLFTRQVDEADFFIHEKMVEQYDYSSLLSNLLTKDIFHPPQV